MGYENVVVALKKQAWGMGDEHLCFLRAEFYPL